MNPENTSYSWPHVVADYERALSVGGRRHLGLFAVEGFRLVERALAANARIAHVLVGQDDLSAPEPRLQSLLEKLRERGLSVVGIPQDTMQLLSEGRTFGSVLALVQMPDAGDLGQLLAAWKTSERRHKLLVLEQMMDPGNVGALLRTAHAMGVEALVALGGTDPFHPRAARTSMGSIFRVPVFRQESATPLLELLRQHEVFTLGAATEALTALPEASFASKDMALFVGNEGKGLSASLRCALDQLVAIPMSAAIDSFSVNAATAVILYAMTHNARRPEGVLWSSGGSAEVVD